VTHNERHNPIHLTVRNCIFHHKRWDECRTIEFTHRMGTRKDGQWLWVHTKGYHPENRYMLAVNGAYSITVSRTTVTGVGTCRCWRLHAIITHRSTELCMWQDHSHRLFALAHISRLHDEFWDLLTSTFAGTRQNCFFTTIPM
jgi:hypothetical protein